MSIKFNIVEGHQTEEHIYNDFKKDFLNPKNTIPDLLKKYDISSNKYNKLRKKVCEETGLKSKPSTNNNKRTILTDRAYIHKHRAGWAIIKNINNKRIYYGTYKDLEYAKKIRNALIKYSWDKSKLNIIKQNIIKEGLNKNV